MHTTLRRIKILVFSVFFVALGGGFFVLSSVNSLFAASSSAKTDVNVLELNQQIKDKKSSIADLRSQIKVYQNNIDSKQKEAASLQNDLGLLDDEISKNTLDIQASEEEIAQLDLEIQQAQLAIQNQTDEIELQRQQLGEYIRRVYQDDQAGYLEILFLHSSLSEFFDQIKYLEQSQGEVQKTLARIRVLKDEMDVQKAGLETSKKQEEETQAALAVKKDALDEQRQGKQDLIASSVLSQEKFQELLDQARAEQASIDSDIASLEKSLQEKIKVFNNKNVSLGWPVDPSRGISAYFHDPSYPYRYVMEHPAIDIRAYQGTPVKAAEDGYVGRTHFNGKEYAFVMLIHDKGLSTVYGHLSRIIVQQDTYVKKGQIIGYSGAAPGTNGAGPFTTGPHLHFEVRLNGIPVDPLKYLP